MLPFGKSSVGTEKLRIHVIEGRTPYFELHSFLGMLIFTLLFMSALARHVDPAMLFQVWLPSVDIRSTTTISSGLFCRPFVLKANFETNLGVIQSVYLCE